MHVLLVYPVKPRLTFGAMPGPYGLETVRTVLAAEGIESTIVNPFLSLDPAAALEAAVRADTALVGLSIRNIDDALTLWDPDAAGEIQTESCLPDLEEVMAWVRAVAPDLPVVLGGAGFGQIGEPLLAYLDADAGLTGASELDFAALMRSMAAGLAFEDALRLVEGALWPGSARGARRSGYRHRAGYPPVVDREAIYFRYRREAAVRTYAGCPLSCAHCIEHLASRQIWRSPIDRVLAEMKEVRTRYPEVRRFFFADSEVNLAGADRLLDLTRAVRRTEGLEDIPLVGYVNPRPAGFAFVKALAKARFEMRFTVDHAADAVLARNGKNFRRADLDALVRDHAALALPFSFCLLLGQPGETEATIEEVLEFVDSIPDAIAAPIYFSPGVRVYPGTPIASDLASGRLDRKWLAGEGDPSFLKPVVYCEGWRPRELFDHVMARAGGRVQPMNGYLQGLGHGRKAEMEREFQAYCIGLAQRDAKGGEALRAWSAVSPAAPFLTTRQRRDFLWDRGLLALERGQPGDAVRDWADLQTDGVRSSKLTHNLAVARTIERAHAAP